MRHAPNNCFPVEAREQVRVCQAKCGIGPSSTRIRMMDFNDDEHLDVCQNIEVGLKAQYELNAELTNTICIFALDNAKIAIKKRFGYAKNEKVADHPFAQGIVQWCVSIGMERIGKVNNLTLSE